MVEDANVWQQRPGSRINPLTLILAAATMAGIIMADALAEFAGWARLVFAAAGVIILAGGFSAWRRGNSRRLFYWQNGLLAALLFLLGAGRMYLAAGQVPADHIVRCATDTPALATLEGHIITEPRILKPEGDFARHDFLHQPGTWFRMDCICGQGPEGFVPLSGQVSVYVRQPALHLECGQRVRLDGEISMRHGADNPGSHSTASNRRRADFSVICTVPVSEAIVIIPEKQNRPQSGNWQALLRQRLLLALSDEHEENPGSVKSDQQAFLAALLVGDRSGLSPALQETFIRAGTLHFLAISGLNIALVTAFGWGLGWLLRLDRRGQALLALAATVVYVALVPACASVLRAGIMGGVFCIAHLARRRAHALNLLSIAAIVIVLAQPMELFNPGFQLSFVVVLGLIALTGLIMNWRSGRDEDLPIFERQQTTGQWLRHHLALWAGGLAAAGLAAWITALPLSAWHFNRISFAGIPATMVLSSLITLLMLTSWLGVLTGWLWPTLGAGLNAVSCLLADATLAINECFARPDWLNLNTAAPPLWVIIVYYVLLGLCVYTWHLRRGHKWTTAAFVVVLAGFLLALPLRKINGAKGPVLHVLSVGDGCAAVLETESTTILYDVGSLNRSQAGLKIVVPFLRQRGINRIDALFISHDNLDHFNGVLDVCRLLTVEKVYLSPLFLEHARKSSSNSAENILLDGLQSLGVPVETIAAGESLTWRQDDLAACIYWPPPQPAMELDDNNSSLAVRFTTRHGSILLCGDVEDVARQALLAQDGDQLRSDVLLLPHHGSVHHYDNLAAFVAAADPALVLNSTGPVPAEQQAALTRLLSGRQFFSTDRCGQISIEMTATGPTASSQRYGPQ